MHFSVRPMQSADLPKYTAYWKNASPAFLRGMGADLTKMNDIDARMSRMETWIAMSIEQTDNYYLTWLIDGQACGHTNVNHLVFGESGTMHLHLWQTQKRLRGAGTALLKLSIPIFFEKLQLQSLYCEPYALNPAPNATLPKVGFEFQKTYRCTPGSINFEQEVNQYLLTRERFERLYLG